MSSTVTPENGTTNGYKSGFIQTGTGYFLLQFQAADVYLSRYFKLTIGWFEQRFFCVFFLIEVLLELLFKLELSIEMGQSVGDQDPKSQTALPMPGKARRQELTVGREFSSSLGPVSRGVWQEVVSRNGNPLQCSWLENPRDGGAWWAAVTQSRIRLKWLSSSSSE